ncbi:hypothetical protein HK098_000028 [Nowakowskiella sp. JEL0407]|nr:hypothetical protein HK098_000028 [Nowakowskiella sp. JEL0407]
MYMRQFQRSFKNVFVDDVQPYFGQLDSFELKDLYAVLTAFTSLDYLHLTEALHSIRIEMPDATWTPLSEPEDLACLSDYRPNLHARITELFSFHDFSHEGSYGLNDFVFLEPPSYFKSECHFSDYLLYSLKCQNWVGVKTIDYDFCWIASDGISAVQVDLEGKYAIMRSPSWEWSVSQYLDLVSDRIAKFYQPLGKNDKVASEQVTFYMGLSAAGWGNYQQEDRSRWSGMNVEDFDPILHRTRENVANFDEY